MPAFYTRPRSLQDAVISLSDASAISLASNMGCRRAGAQRNQRQTSEPHHAHRPQLRPRRRCCPHDAELMPLITTANVACGFHAGDAGAFAALRLAAQYGVQAGAHPGFADRDHFGAATSISRKHKSTSKPSSRSAPSPVSPAPLGLSCATSSRTEHSTIAPAGTPFRPANRRRDSAVRPRADGTTRLAP